MGSKTVLGSFLVGDKYSDHQTKMYTVSKAIESFCSSYMIVKVEHRSPHTVDKLWYSAKTYFTLIKRMESFVANHFFSNSPAQEQKLELLLNFSELSYFFYLTLRHRGQVSANCLPMSSAPAVP